MIVELASPDNVLLAFFRSFAVQTISEYIVLVETIPSLSNDVVHCIVEQLQVNDCLLLSASVILTCNTIVLLRPSAF